MVKSTVGLNHTSTTPHPTFQTQEKSPKLLHLNPKAAGIAVTRQPRV